MRFSFKAMAFISIVIGSFQNCSAPDSALVEERVDRARAENEPDASSKVSCQFIGREGLRSMLQTVVGMRGDDVAMVNEAGEPLRSPNCKSFNHDPSSANSCFYFAEYESELNRRTCDSSLFRLVSQIFINACTEVVQSQELAARIFPEGSEHPDSLYLAFTGRWPRSDEKKILRDLASQFQTEQEKQGAICAAIGSSFGAIKQ